MRGGRGEGREEGGEKGEGGSVECVGNRVV